MFFRHLRVRQEELYGSQERYRLVANLISRRDGKCLQKILGSLLKEFKSSGKDEKAFANYLQQSVACVIASVVKNGDLPSLELHVQRLNE